MNHAVLITGFSIFDTVSIFSTQAEAWEYAQKQLPVEFCDDKHIKKIFLDGGIGLQQYSLKYATSRGTSFNFLTIVPHICHSDPKLICVSFLSENATKGNLLSLFHKYGHINDCVVIKGLKTAYIHFNDSRNAQDALELNGTLFHGNHIKVELLKF